MKKLFIVSFLFVFSLALAGCGKKQASAPAAEEAVPAKGGGLQVLDQDLKGYMTANRGVECTVSDKQGKVTMRSQDGNVLISGMPDPTGADKEAFSLTTGDWLYTWSGDEGTKMNLKDLAAMSESVDDTEETPKTWEESVDEWENEGVDYTCRDKNFSSDTFEPPANVNFVDLTANLKSLSEMGQNLQEQMESGDEMDLDALQKQAEEMQRRFKVNEQ